MDSSEPVITFPLMELPPELREMVIAQVEDSKDVVYLRKAAPELLPLVKGANRLFWLFDQMLPILFLLLRKKDILALRLVCKGWALDMDEFLKEHPSRRAYQDKDGTRGQLWIPEATTNFHDLDWYPYMITTTFRRAEDFTRLFREAEGHPPKRSPFVGGHVTLHCPCDFLVWSRAMELLRRFGGKILYLQVISPAPFQDLKYFHRCTLLHHLHHLPNLRSLHFQNSGRQHLHFRYGGQHQPEPPFFDLGERTDLVFPHLPHLESLQFGEDVSVPPKIMSLLLATYGHQICKLSLHAGLLQGGFSHLLRSLTQLEILGVTHLSKERVYELLLSILAPRLMTLSLRGNQIIQFTEEEMFRWLSRFPKLVSLSLECTVELSSLQNKSRPIYPSLRFLSVESYDLPVTLDWLLSFPGLEGFTTEDWEYEKFFEEGYYTESSVFGLEVWRSLQELKEIHIRDGSGPGAKLHFRRERKDHLERLERLAVLPP